MDLHRWLDWAGPSPWRRALVVLAAALLLAVWFADFLDRMRDTPENVRSLMSVLANTSWAAWSILAVGIACLIVATYDAWLPMFQPTSPARVPITARTISRESASAERSIKFWLPGRSTLAPFRIEHVGNDKNGPIYSEQISLRLEAVKPMRDVSCLITLRNGRDIKREVKLDGDEYLIMTEDDLLAVVG